MAKKIPLSKGYFAIVDDADFDWLNQWKWHYCKGYASRGKYIGMFKGKQRTERIFMHRVILETQDGFVTDHIDRDKLNNQRENLRQATRSQNQGNRGCHIKTSSKFKGVHWSKKDENWKATIKDGNKQRHIGTFSREEDAALAYNFAAHNYFGDFAAFNVVGG